MKKIGQGSGEGVKRTSEALTEQQIQTLEWARDFMKKYEKRHG